MRIKFWGVRGSTPTPQPENMRYGGNTSCVEVRFGDRIYIFDCGTGFRVLGQQLQSEFGEKPFSAHVFVSHFHWDHIQGMPFFRPLYANAENRFLFQCSTRTRSPSTATVAPIAWSISSVWSLVFTGSTTEVASSAKSAARRIADFTCALGMAIV